MKTHEITHHDALSVHHNNTNDKIIQQFENLWFCHCKFTLLRIFVSGNKFSTTSVTSTSTTLGASPSSVLIVPHPSSHPCSVQVKGNFGGYDNAPYCKQHVILYGGPVASVMSIEEARMFMSLNAITSQTERC